MSTRVETWKDAVRSVVRPYLIAGTRSSVTVGDAREERAVEDLVRQTFFPARDVPRTRVLFAGTDSAANSSRVCELAAKMLAAITARTVAIIGSDWDGPLQTAPTTTSRAADWRVRSSQIADSVWRVGSWCLPGPAPSLPAGELPFDYALFSARVSDGALPLFSNWCEGAVLVIAANRTRREAALSAKELLLKHGVDVLGAVLDGRTLPVPERIYQLL